MAMMRSVTVLAALTAAMVGAVQLRGDMREADPDIPTPDPNDPIQIVGKVNGVETIGESYATVMGMAKPWTEKHAMEGVMNTKYALPTGHHPEKEVVMKDVHSSSMYAVMGNHDVYKTPLKNATRETKDSVANGKSNAKYLEKRREENEALPENLRHKTLTEIWKKELPCECPFNQWKPVCGIDGNTYPTACFADCISVPIFVHADCKYVKRELWARLKAKGAASDMYEECEETKDTADDEPRPRCRRPGLIPNAVPEDGEDPAPDEDVAEASQGAVTALDLLGSARAPNNVDEAVEELPPEAVAAAPAVAGDQAEKHEQVTLTSASSEPLGALPQPTGVVASSAPAESFVTPAVDNEAAAAVAGAEMVAGQELMQVQKLEQRLGQRLPELEEQARKQDAAMEQATAAAVAAAAAARRPPAPQRKATPMSAGVATMPEHSHDGSGEQAARGGLGGRQQQQQEQQQDDDDQSQHIEYRVFNGMRVPYDTRDVENPCPHCSPKYAPACGSDGKTYPSACFAKCVGARIAKMGECDQLQ